ncbi:uncharacterized protein LOC130110415 isoform X4 [Lampris incognitus]|uniref:uncharacterized protein LOC130110415 isoform X4 n=1 Tax=Lampris incognitus TaxID=2546036 RepID=UPI0024B55C99|nr:uncharacterized protein LOC130110415 isoform X4 [Lampris incognitus]
MSIDNLKSVDVDKTCRLCKESLLVRGVITNTRILFSLNAKVKPLHERFRDIGVILPQRPGVCSRRICAKCYRTFVGVEEAVAVLKTWKAEQKTQENDLYIKSKMFREMGCQTKVMTFDAECQTEPSENDLQWQTSSADSMQSHKKPSRRRKDHLRISHDKMMETTGGYGTTVCSEFDKECESLHGQLQVKVETEEVHIQDVHHAFMEIKPVKVKEEPDDCPSSSTSNIYGVIEQALPSPGHLKQEEEEPEAVTQYEDIVKVVVKQEDEKLILVKEEDKISEF